MAIIGNARIAETGGVNGTKGDQTGREVMTQDWSTGGTWSYVIRAKSDAVANKIAAAMKAACANNNIGYSQSDRRSLYNIVSKNGWNIAAAGRCNCDCSSLVAVCVNAAGIKVSPDMYTGNELRILQSTGAFTTYTAASYTKSAANLKTGDILLRTGHTAVVVQGISRGSATPTPAKQSLDVVAQQVKSGKFGNGDARKAALKRAGYSDAEIKQIQEKVNALVKAPASTSKKSNEQIAAEIIDGKWGNGTARVNALRRAGYDAEAIQKIVNQKLKAKPAKKSLQTIAAEIIAGKWGNGAARKAALKRAGYSDAEIKQIQAIVNKRL